jgi:hypothetical protein
MIGAKNIKVFNDNKDEINKIFDDLFMDKDLKIEKIREIMADFNFSLSDIDKVCDNYKNLKDRFLRERFDMEIKV